MSVTGDMLDENLEFGWNMGWEDACEGARIRVDAIRAEYDAQLDALKAQLARVQLDRDTLQKSFDDAANLLCDYRKKLAAATAQAGELRERLGEMVHFARLQGCNRTRPGDCDACAAIERAAKALASPPPKQPAPVAGERVEKADEAIVAQEAAEAEEQRKLREGINAAYRGDPVAGERKRCTCGNANASAGWCVRCDAPYTPSTQTEAKRTYEHCNGLDCRDIEGCACGCGPCLIRRTEDAQPVAHPPVPHPPPTEKGEGAPERNVVHPLKCWPVYFEGIASGQKRFELRKDDRDFRTGDALRLQEWSPDRGEYTGRECLVKVLYLVQGSAVAALIGLPQNISHRWVCMSIERVDHDARRQGKAR
jgi:hypothetical protein